MIVILIIFTVWWAHETSPQPIINWWESRLGRTYNQFNFSHNKEVERDVEERLRNYVKDIYFECTSLVSSAKTAHVKHLVDWTSLSQNTPSIKKCLYKYRNELISCQVISVPPGRNFTSSEYKHHSKFRTVFSLDSNDNVEKIGTEKITNFTSAPQIILILEFSQKFPSSYHNWCNNLFHRFLRHNKYNQKSFKKINKNV